ncbi:protein disulfide-isomerase precursor, putative [Entamoeba invadens IP1]|uniref:Protein disulfide-isomerase, putative n=1 Tax=Entamoeba invadens IP1 TaxID=370355 RepID=A0A0A1U901_ENTIV|nr:protein disulfide-isomerase precursor, putative [Entamoeba invadens IP1]ELP91385.1 protein disulfide-isomerase precursor, putative [Entamoeba invadens IP1]|eukprot:XP_004258156.1 protein disulfide-isomerase precursor, putative [Entamoeba invadens IP1]
MLVIFCVVALCSGLEQILNDQLNEFVTANKFSVIFYSLPWCIHCKELRPVIEELDAQNQNKRSENRTYALANIDCGASQCQITQFPQLLFYRNGVFFSSYDGLKKVASIQRWIHRNMEPVLSIVDEDDIEDFQNEYHTLMVFKFNSTKQIEKYSAFIENIVTRYFSESRRFMYFVKRGPSELAITAFTHSLFDENKLVKASFQTNTKSDELTFFIKEHIAYPYQKFTPEYQFLMKYFEKSVALIYSEDFNDGNLISQSLEKNWGNVFGGFVSLKDTITVNTTFGLNAQRLFPTKKHLRIITKAERITYDYFGKWTPKEMNKWIEDVIQSKVDPTIRSSVVPTQFNQNVTELTAETFDNFVSQDTNVVVLVHKGIHKNEQTYFKIFSSVANKLAKNPKIAFGHINVLLNDVLVKEPLFQLPTILVYPHIPTKYIEMPYAEYPDARQIYNFIRKNAEIGFDETDNLLFLDGTDYVSDDIAWTLEHYEQLFIKKRSQENASHNDINTKTEL